MNGRLSRREFLGASAAVAAGLARARSPRGLRIAFVGIGGRGKSNLEGLAPGNRVAAICDVDDRQIVEAAGRFPDAKRYRDYRRMFEEAGNALDAVSISTPDHTHAAVALEAIRRGLHVYCEKPLAHSIHEVRLMAAAARGKGVVTQMGNQGHASDTIRRFVEVVRAGSVGTIHTVHAGSISSYSKMRELALLNERPPVPEWLDWDAWLGPAPERPYHPAYMGGKWRGWKAFGTGVIGDWTCHVLDPAFWALDLGSPSSVEAVSVGDYDPVRHGETFPSGATIRFEFPARAGRGSVTVYWHSGFDVRKMPRPEGLDAGQEMPVKGALLLGDRGAIIHGFEGAADFRVIPPPGARAPEPPPATLPSAGNPYKEFQAAIHGGHKAGSDFAEYGGPLTEVALLGVSWRDSHGFAGEEAVLGRSGGPLHQLGGSQRADRPRVSKGMGPVTRAERAGPHRIFRDRRPAASYRAEGRSTAKERDA